MKHLFVILVLVVLISCEVIDLVPDVTRFRESLRPGESKLYRMTNLQSEKKYEIRVSYPATMPAIFTIKVSNELSSLRGTHNKKLLNIEKEIFEAKSQEMYAHVHVEREGESWDPKIRDSPIIFNIIVETLVFGSVPSSAIRLIILVIVSMTLVIFAVYKLVTRSKTRDE
jgi:hypothetical protein